ncbi:MAG: hypothetical protein KF688_13740 [Pirellulales bacterium]|nr:hypothetical protein [Pirellulales bacterium]
MKKRSALLGLVLAGAGIGLVLPAVVVALTTDSAVADCGKCGDKKEEDDDEARFDGDCDKKNEGELLADCKKGEKHDSDEQVRYDGDCDKKNEGELLVDCKKGEKHDSDEQSVLLA